MRSSSKVTIVTQYFYPSLSATAQLMTDLGSGMSKLSPKVAVDIITGTQIESNESKEKIEDINRVVRIFSPVKIGSGILNKIINSLFFLLGTSLQVIFTKSKHDRLLIASNPPYIGIVGLLFRLLKRGKYYFLLQDIFPESAVLAGIFSKNSFLFNLFDRLIYLVCKHSQKTIVLNSDMQNFLRSKYGDIKDKITIIENWAVEDIPKIEKKDNKFACDFGLDRKFTVSYSGNMGRLHDIETILEAAKILKDRPIQFVFIGDGAKTKLVEEAIEFKQLNNISLLPFQPRENLPLSLTACDIALVSLLPGAESIVAPSKLYGILAAGRGVIAISSAESNLEVLLTENNCGINVPPFDSQKLASTILELSQQPLKVSDMGINARYLYQQKYIFSRALHEYCQIILEK